MRPPVRLFKGRLFAYDAGAGCVPWLAVDGPLCLKQGGSLAAQTDRCLWIRVAEDDDGNNKDYFVI